MEMGRIPFQAKESHLKNGRGGKQGAEGAATTDCHSEGGEDVTLSLLPSNGHDQNRLKYDSDKRIYEYI